MGEDLIKKNDIVEKFLVTAMYGTNVKEWPSKTIAACKIICTDKDGKTWVSHQIYKNDRNDHAEVKLIEYLHLPGNALEASRIIIEVYMNYSPCSECSKAIRKYMKDKKSLKREIKMTITFANFYKTHEYPGNDINTARANIKGLKALYKEHKVNLLLLGRDVKWKRFLGMGEFFRFEEGEEDECLDKARSDERKRREVQDEIVWDRIFNDWFGVIISALDSDQLEEIRKALGVASLTSDLR